MGEIIRTWLRTRLGVIIDLSPEIFGHYARDGTLLAKVLHSYDIINENQLSTLNRTQDPALCRVNLKNLRIWLRFIGVDCDDDCTEDISNGKGTTALRLFYKLFLALENKDSLHFITLQKEREKFVPNSSKFEVTTVREEPEYEEPEDHPLAGPLKRGASLIEWQRKKHSEFIEGSKRRREKFHTSQERNERWKQCADGPEKSAPRRRSRSVLEEAEMRELDEFARKHRVKESKEALEPCEVISRFGTDKAEAQMTDHEAAKAYTRSLKQKYRQEAMTKSFKTRMQKALLSEVWEKVVSDQEMEFDELIARKVLDQSQFEKKMMRKLCDIRNEKTRMAANRQIVEELSQRTKEREARVEQERAREVLVRESEEVEAERRRMNELERRINEDMERRKRRKLRRIGEEVVNDLIDVSTLAAEHKIASDGDEPPKTLWNKWIALFVKSQPIVEAADDDFAQEVGGDEIEEEEIGEEIDNADYERVEILNDDDFENYHKLRTPWDDFLPDVDVENREFMDLGAVVLGYIVHKLLGSLYPNSEEFVEAPLPKMKIRATVLGIPDTLLYEPIRELLKHSRIHLVCMEEAINYCLGRYKAEMKDYEYIDLNIVAATKQTSARQSSGSAGGRGKKLQKKEKKSASSGMKTGSSTKRIDQARSGIDKVTQTPRVIPYEDMDPTLSDTAYIGKWTHEFLTLGQPLSDDLNARILLEYLKSLEDVQGFVLVNYPTTYRQMTSLELTLTGRRLPDRPDKYFTGAEETNIEEIESVPSRITFESEGHDSLKPLKKSRLLPDPSKRLETSDKNSYFTAFVRIKPKSRDSRREEVAEYEILPDDWTSLEAFYVDQDIAFIFYYTIFDLSTLKRLARVLITGGTSQPKISSRELFGEAMEYFDGRSEDNSSVGKAPIFKKLFPRASVSSFGESGASEWADRSDERNEVATSGRSKEERPGEPEWSWVDLPQPLQLLQSLATLWQGLETRYIENLKDIFQVKRTNLGAAVPYINFVKKHMREFIERPDKKQDLLHEFHRAFNDIDEDVRGEVETKRELHCRVADFEAMLWDICNDRRKEAEEERKKIILDHWTTQEAITLANVYIGILQAEIDRSVDTFQLVQDYYLAMLQRPLQEVRQSRILLQVIPLETQSSASKQEITSMKKLSSKSLKEKESKETRAKTSSVKVSPSSLVAEENVFREEIAKLLVDVQQENFDPTQTICYKSVEANVRFVQTHVEAIATSVLDALKKEETAASKLPTESKEKKGSSKKNSQPSRTHQGSTGKRTQDLFLEWRHALRFEINRIRLRLKILEAAARSDINFLLDEMRRLFFGIHKLLVDRYKSEEKSVNLMASTFRFAIEEATPIQEEMLLDGDRFLVRSNVLMYPDKSQSDFPATKEEKSPSNFQMAQLGRLFDIFNRVAPSGTIGERSFVYILQDLIACGDEEGGTSVLPASWFHLRACDVPRLVDDVFGDVQFVDWREFIIYAMEIEMPSMDQLLDALESFRQMDKNSTDTVTCEEFHSVGLWFFDWKDSDVVYSSSALHEDFERDEEDMQEKEETTVFQSTLEKRRNSARHSCSERDMKPESILRLTLGKELLYEMFLSEYRRVNYVALLLAFCKDEEPKKGLAKALSLAIGNKICADWNEGEKYVEGLIELRRRSAEEKASRKYLPKEAKLTSEAILDGVLKRVLRRSKVDASEPDEVLSMTKYDNDEAERTPIRIEKLDAPGESVDLADLLPADDNASILPMSDVDRVATLEEIDTHVPRVTITLPDDCEEKKRAQTVQRELVYWLSLEDCQAVLAAMLPRLATQPDLFETGKSLRENLRLVCLELRDEELNDEAEQILAHRFLEHSFVKKVIFDVSQFTTRRIGKVVDKILGEKK